MLLLSNDREHFKGFVNLKEQKGDRERRFDNATEVKNQLMSINRNWTDQRYQQWIQTVQSKVVQENVEISMKKHQGNQYDLNNSAYRRKFQSRLGLEAGVAPTFQGGGFKNCNEFLLPTIEREDIKQ